MVPSDDAILRNSGELNTHFGKCASFAPAERDERQRRKKGRGHHPDSIRGHNEMRKRGHRRREFHDVTSGSGIPIRRRDEGRSVIRNAPAAILHPFGREENCLSHACKVDNLEAKKKLRSQTSQVKLLQKLQVR